MSKLKREDITYEVVERLFKENTNFELLKNLGKEDVLLIFNTITGKETKDFTSDGNYEMTVVRNFIDRTTATDSEEKKQKILYAILYSDTVKP